MLFLHSDRGQSLVEYALVLVLVAIAVIVGLTLLGSSVNGVFSSVVTALEAGMGPGAGGDCFGSLLLPYLLGLTSVFAVSFRVMARRSIDSAAE